MLMAMKRKMTKRRIGIEEIELEQDEPEAD